MPVLKRGERWQYDFRLNGRRYRESIPEARTKRQAEQAEVQARMAIFEGKFGRQRVAPTLSDFITKTYLPWAKANKRSWKHDEFRTRPLIKALGKKRLDEISMIQVERYKQDRRKTKSKREEFYSPASVNRELELLSAIFNHAIDSDIIVPNPCRKVKRFDEDNARNRYLSYEEEVRLLALLRGRRGHLLPIVQLAIHTGLRKSELLSLRWANVDFQRGLIHALNSQRERTKGKKNRSIPMNSMAREILLSLSAHNMSKKVTTEYVFFNPQTGTHLGDIKKGFAAACQDAKIEDFCFHDLRRTAATRLGDAGANAFQIAAILGHADVETSKIYTVSTDEGLRRAMETLTGKPAKQEQLQAISA
jgi:integrase